MFFDKTKFRESNYYLLNNAIYRIFILLNILLPKTSEIYFLILSPPVVCKIVKWTVFITLMYCKADPIKPRNLRCQPFLNSKNVGKTFGESVYIFVIFVFVKFSTWTLYQRKNIEIFQNGIYCKVCLRIH